MRGKPLGFLSDIVLGSEKVQSLALGLRRQVFSDGIRRNGN